MARKRRDRKIGKHSVEQMRDALALKNQGLSLRKAAERKSIPYATLRRYFLKQQRFGENIKLTPNYEINRVFTEEQEASLKEYLFECAYAFYGLTNKDCRQIAYQMAKYNNISMQTSWSQNEIAGVEWLRSFRKRHSELTLRCPERCSLARATAFNKSNVEKFFDNLHNIMQRHPRFADGTRIFNLDETSTTTVQKPQKVLAPKGIRCLSKVTSGEKGTLVTTCCIISASGQSLPPVLVFPRVHFKTHMLNGTPTGSLGLATSSGWMNGELFIEVMRHFVKHSSSSKDNPSLLIMDNHESHLTIQTLDIAKDNGVTVLTLPPHTTHKTQPLDVGVMKPFKDYFNASMESWMLRNPGVPVTIYELGSFIGEAYQKAMTPTTISSAFRKTGIFPFDRNIFSELDFLPSTVTDRPDPGERILYILDNNEAKSPNEIKNAEILCSSQDCTGENPWNNDAGPSSNRENLQYFGANNDTVPSISTLAEDKNKHFVSPKEFRQPLRAAARKNARQNRKKKRSLIATDTPEKEQLAMEKEAKKRKVPNKTKRVILESSSSDSETSVVLESDSEESEEGVPEIITFSLNRQPLPDDFVLVEFESKKRYVYYVAKVLKINDDIVSVSFLRKKFAGDIFYMPLVPDLADVNTNEIKTILPEPRINGSTSRQHSYLTFDVDMSSLDIR